MNEGWWNEDYYTLFDETDLEQVTKRYGIARHLPGHTVVGLKGWDNFIVRDAHNGLALVPTVPAIPLYLEPLSGPAAAVVGRELTRDRRCEGKIKWWITPLIFGGKPEDPSNQTWISPTQHAKLVRWWNDTYQRMIATKESNPRMRESRIAGGSGILFSILSLAVLPFAMPPPPALGASGAEFVAWFSAHRTGFLIGNYLGIIAFFPGFVQLAFLAARIRKSDETMASLVMATGTFAYAVFACSLVAFQVMPFVIDPKLADLMGTFANLWFALDGLAALPLVLAVGWAGARTGTLPRWFVRLSWVTALVCFAMSLGALTATPVWLAGGGPATAVGFVGFFAWIVALAVLSLKS